MKTAISVNDDLMIQADRLALEMGVSRSRLFSLALEKYMRGLKHEQIVERLNQVYGTDAAAEKRVAKQIKQKFRSSTTRERW